MIFLKHHTPRWIIFIIDIFICLFAIVLAYLLRFNFNIENDEIKSLQFVIPFVIVIRLISFIIGKSYAGIIRFTSTKDAERIFIIIFIGTFFFLFSNAIRYYFIDGAFVIPISIVIIDFITTVFIMTTLRIVVKILYFEINHPKKDRTNVVIYGTDQLGLITKRTLDRDDETNHKVIAFIENKGQIIKSKLEGTTIYGVDNLEDILEKNNVSKLIIAKSNIEKDIRNKIIEICLSFDVQVLTVPEVSTWINGELSFNQIKNIKIEDLLGRTTIKLDKKQIKKQILNKIVLVTGAAGSIGSEIVYQLTKYNPKNIILFDQAESPLYDLELTLKERHNFQNFKIIIGDITNKDRLRFVLKKYKPTVIYHAAAYKHVPMMEKNPAEAIMTNVVGTKTISDLAVEYNVENFVMISTDKAVNPTNVMGASKKIAETYTGVLNHHHSTNFITTRFGNVLGSNGSVIPRFAKQIENGGPITVTHPDVTRYFMTIPEACQLVLEAGAMGKGGEIYLFDMGKSIKIVDLAKKMVKLSGLELGKDINLKFTGLRPGEKLYEELLCNEENSISTHHSQIMIAKVVDIDQENFINKLNDLILLVKTFDNYKIVAKMKELVPEFKSKNSVYETLDNGGQ